MIIVEHTPINGPLGARLRRNPNHNILTYTRVRGLEAILRNHYFLLNNSKVHGTATGFSSLTLFCDSGTLFFHDT